MRILYATSMSLEKEKNSGNKIHFVEIGKALKKMGHDVVLIAPYYSNNGTKENYGLIDEQISLGKKNIFNYLLFHNQLIKKLPALLGKYKPDFFYSRDLKNVPKINQKLNRKDIFHFVEINGLIKDSHFKPYFLKKILANSQKKQINAADLIRVMTKEQKEMIIKEFNKNPSEIFIIRHGTNPNVFKDRGKKNSRKKINLNEKSFIFTFIGTYNSMTYINGLIMFLKSFKKFIDKKCQNSELLLLGEGKHKPLLAHEVNALNLQNHVHFTGQIKNEKVPDYISASDICLQVWIPERKDKEGLSLKLSSYLSCERRIITSDIKGFRDILEPFDPLFWNLEDEESMYQCINKAYEERNTWSKGKAQRQYVLDKFTWEIAAKKICEAFLKKDKNKTKLLM